MRPSLRSTYHSTIKRTCLFIFHRLNDKDMQFYTTRLDISLQFDYHNSYVHSYTYADLCTFIQCSTSSRVYEQTKIVLHIALLVLCSVQKIFCQKIRENNVFTKRVTKKLFSRNFFPVRKNLVIFHTACAHIQCFKPSSKMSFIICFSSSTHREAFHHRRFFNSYRFCHRSIIDAF